MIKFFKELVVNTTVLFLACCLGYGVGTAIGNLWAWIVYA